MKIIFSIILLLIGLSVSAQTANSKKCYTLLLIQDTDNLKEQIEKIAQNTLISIQLESVDNIEENGIKFYTTADIVLVRKFCLKLVEQKIPIEHILKDCEGKEIEKF